MTDFAYVARNKAGVVEKSVMSAMNERAVAEALRAQGLLPTLIKPVGRAIDINAIFNAIRSIKLLDKITFIKELYRADSVKNGVDINCPAHWLDQSRQQTLRPQRFSHGSLIHGGHDAFFNHSRFVSGYVSKICHIILY